MEGEFRLTRRHRMDVSTLAFTRYDCALVVLRHVAIYHPKVIQILRELPSTKEGVCAYPGDVAEASLALERAGKGYLRPLSDVFPFKGAHAESEQEQLFRIALFPTHVVGAEIVVLVSAQSIAWASAIHLACEPIEVSASLLRARWATSGVPQPGEDPLRGLSDAVGMPLLVAATLIDADFSDIAPDIGAMPMFESESQFVARAKEHYRARQVTAKAQVPGRSTGRVKVPKLRELERHAGWLVRVQVGGESPKDIAATSGATREAVDKAVRRLARVLGLRVRDLPKTGRRPKSKESHHRRRTTGGQT